MAFETILLDIHGKVGLITLNRPQALNALNAQIVGEINQALDQLERDPNIGCVVLTGSAKAFAAGADIKEMAELQYPQIYVDDLFSDSDRIANRRKPIIAAVNGMAMGGGFEAALACDIIIAAEHATFGLTEPRVGLAALGGGIQRVLEELGPKRAHMLLLTARKISAQQISAMGMIAEIVAPGELMAAARRWADEILECSPASIAATKAVIQSLDGHSVEHSMKDMFHLPEVRSLLSGPDAREGPKAFAEKRKPNWADPA